MGALLLNARRDPVSERENKSIKSLNSGAWTGPWLRRRSLVRTQFNFVLRRGATAAFEDREEEKKGIVQFLWKKLSECVHFSSLHISLSSEMHGFWCFDKWSFFWYILVPNIEHYKQNLSVWLGAPIVFRKLCLKMKFPTLYSLLFVQLRLQKWLGLQKSWRIQTGWNQKRAYEVQCYDLLRW